MIRIYRIKTTNPTATDTNPFRYYGEYFDRETGTVYLRARYYDPVIERVISEDTHWNTNNSLYGDNPPKINNEKDRLGLNNYTYVPSIESIRQSGNLYAYGMNNPVMFSDSSGKFVITATMLYYGGLAFRWKE